MSLHHPVQWKKIQTAWAQQRIPQAMFFVGPAHCHIEHFVTQMMPLFFCKGHQQNDCGCNDCHMIHRMEHPDIEWVRPEKAGSAIKIDQIRELHHSAYLTPQRANHRVIIIEAADRMNTAAANALLKILEEPAPHTLFILIAQQLSTVLPTILSRCHITTFSSADDSGTNNLLNLGEMYSEEADRAIIVRQSEKLLQQLIALIEGREHPCGVAAQWSQFEFNTLLWFLYLTYSQLIHMYFNPSVVSGPAVSQLNTLLSLINPILLFSQIDKINGMLRKLSHNMNMNQTLALEDLLFSLVSST